jgi:AbrB family looped-hinge helix DNA binding protein
MEGKMGIEASRITRKGQIVIPAKLRRRYGIEPGTKVLFIERNDEIFLQPVTKEYVRSVHGMLASKTPTTDDLLKDRTLDRAYEEANAEKG